MHTNQEAPQITRAQKALQQRREFLRELVGDPDSVVPQTSESAQQYAARIREKQHNQDFMKFANRCCLGEAIPQQDIITFLADPRRIGVEKMVAIQAYSGKTDLTEAEQTEFHQALDASLITIEIRADKAEAADQQREAVQKTAFEAAVNLTLTANGGNTVPALEHPDPAVQSSLNQLMELRINHAKQQTWEHGMSHLTDSIKQTAAEVNTANTTGVLPHWFNPEKHAIDPQLARQGHNFVHPYPVDPFDQPENIARTLKDQIEHYLELAEAVHLPTHPSEIAKNLIRPYLDATLAADFPHHDPGDFYYVDDGPINFQEYDNHRILLNNVDDPATHASTTYCRAIRQALMNQGLADDVYMDRPNLLAMSLPRNAQALQRLAAFLNKECERLQAAADNNSQERNLERDHAYQPAIRWDQGNTAAWQRMGELTAGMTDNTGLKDAIDHMGQHLTNTFKTGDYYQSENSLRPYTFIHQLEIDLSTDVDHPARTLLRGSTRRPHNCKPHRGQHPGTERTERPERRKKTSTGSSNTSEHGRLKAPPKPGWTP